MMGQVGGSGEKSRVSSTLLGGMERAPARSYLRNIGYSSEDLAQPIIGVAHCWTDTSPCNLNHRDVAMKSSHREDMR